MSTSLQRLFHNISVRGKSLFVLRSIMCYYVKLASKPVAIPGGLVMQDTVRRYSILALTDNGHTSSRGPC